MKDGSFGMGQGTRTPQGPFNGALMALNSRYLGYIRGQLGGQGRREFKVCRLGFKF